MKTTDQLRELIKFARQCSPFYRKHLAAISASDDSLDNVPVVDPLQYWRESQRLDHWPVLTGPMASALVFKTGGSTSAGKLSIYEREEWRAFVTDFGQSLTAQFNPGDRVANLFFCGDLYASFLFTHDALRHVDTDITEFPFTGSVDLAALAETIPRQRINVLAGVPAQLLTFASWLSGRGQTLPEVETILYGGESLFTAQRTILRQAFPAARIASIGYASVDAGLIGVSHRDCSEGEHRMCDGHSIVEIVDEQTGEVIDTCERIGLLVLTNLTRRLMPVIRYPVGDRACWREPAGTAMRKFALKGRSASSERVRVGILSLMPGEIGERVRRDVDSDTWQLVIEQAMHKDVLTLKWVANHPSPAVAEANRTLEAGLIELYPLIEQLRKDQLLELRILHCTFEDLPRHPRSGKCLRVLDLRDYQHDAAESA